MRVDVHTHIWPDRIADAVLARGDRCSAHHTDMTPVDPAGLPGLNIHDVLTMTVDQALLFFKDQPKIQTALQPLVDVGLGYIQLGQPATTLSGGEAQRVKLSRELSKRDTGRTLYLLDEASKMHIYELKDYHPEAGIKAFYYLSTN